MAYGLGLPLVPAQAIYPLDRSGIILVDEVGRVDICEEQGALFAEWVERGVRVRIPLRTD